MLQLDSMAIGTRPRSLHLTSTRFTSPPGLQQPQVIDCYAETFPINVPNTERNKSKHEHHLKNISTRTDAAL